VQTLKKFGLRLMPMMHCHRASVFLRGINWSLSCWMFVRLFLRQMASGSNHIALQFPSLLPF
jgi:hypothetical protein